jgi:hypothetical protein
MNQQSFSNEFCKVPTPQGLKHLMLRATLSGLTVGATTRSIHCLRLHGIKLTGLWLKMIVRFHCEMRFQTSRKKLPR